MWRWLSILLAVTVLAPRALEQNLPILSGGQGVRIVQPGESLSSLGARYGVEPRVLARVNGLKTNAVLRTGQALMVDSRHIIPLPEQEDEIVINVPQRMLFQFAAGKLAAAYPVAVGRASWPTFLGRFSVEILESDPVWDVPISIQDEQRRAGRTVLTHVPPGRANPLGKYWIGLDRPGFGIHGTNEPTSIHGFRTHGCIRLHPDDVSALYHSTRVGTAGRIIYECVLLAITDAGVFLEVHPDPYRRQPDASRILEALVRRANVSDLIDDEAVADAIRRRDGSPVDVTARN